MKRVLTAILVLILSACGGNKSTDATVSTPQFAGTWSGTYSVTSCSQTGDMASVGLCETAPVGTTLPDRFELAQTGKTVTGTFYLGSLAFPFSATTIASDGTLTLGAIYSSNGVAIAATWNLKLIAGILSGTVTQVWTGQGLTGQININGSIAGGSTIKTASIPGAETTRLAPASTSAVAPTVAVRDAIERLSRDH